MQWNLEMDPGVLMQRRYKALLTGMALQLERWPAKFARRFSNLSATVHISKVETGTYQLTSNKEFPIGLTEIETWDSHHDLFNYIEHTHIDDSTIQLTVKTEAGGQLVDDRLWACVVVRVYKSTEYM